MIELVLDFKKDTALYVQLYRHIKTDIENGRIQPHERIPSIRQAAKELQLSRTTVENAYAQLSLEGYLYSRNKSGYYACDMGEEFLHMEKERDDRAKKWSHEQQRHEEYIDENNLNLPLWRKYYNYIISNRGKSLFLNAEPQGEYELREQISSYIYNARGVNCNPESIVVGAGVQVLLGILSVILKGNGLARVAFEEPGFTDVRHIFRDYGFDIFPVNVGNSGLNIASLKQSGARICYVSPTHQYPTGHVMPVSKRIQLLGWAIENEAYIIEDDYDSELRYSGRPVPSLQSLDAIGRVVYLGSFSKVLMPSLRISYMALPDRIIEAYMAIKHRYNQTVSKIEQLALALFMEEGEFKRHLRRTRKRYASKNEKFKTILAGKFDGTPVKIGSPDSGTDIMVHTGLPACTKKIVQSLLEEGVPVRHIKNDLVLFSYCSIPENKMEQAAERFIDYLMSAHL